jgi:hypothetical protein
MAALSCQEGEMVGSNVCGHVCSQISQQNTTIKILGYILLIICDTITTYYMQREYATVCARVLRSINHVPKVMNVI